MSYSEEGSDYLEKVVLAREQEKAVMNAMYDFVVRTITDSKKATPAELEALPGMTTRLIDYWTETSF